jgi:hypothetical protein
MITDPRTLCPVTAVSQCHLIPDCFNVSNKTVLLDGPFDNKIGEQCDCHLKASFDLLVGDTIKGGFAFEGGSQNMAGRLGSVTQEFQISQRVRINKKRRHKRWTPRDWCRKALGMRDDGQVKIVGFVTPSVDLAKARLSMVNSAFLVLYYLGRKEIYCPEFDQARILLDKVCAGTLDKSDLPLIEEMTPGFALVCISTEKTKGLSALNPADLRKYYDPSLDVTDGVLHEFPKNCVVEAGESLLVRLPYGKCLRGVVRFPLPRAMSAHDTAAHATCKSRMPDSGTMSRIGQSASSRSALRDSLLFKVNLLIVVPSASGYFCNLCITDQTSCSECS